MEISQIPPMIKQHFNPDLLLDFLGRIYRRLEKKIKPLAAKKIRKQDVGKDKEFKKLLNEFKDLYDRKEVEKEIYNQKIKELIKKRPHIPVTGGTMQFKRMDARK